MISVDVGKSYIKIAELESKGKDFYLKSSQMIPIYESCIDSENQLNKEVLIDYLSESFANMKSKEVVISFSCLPTISNEYTLPYEKNPQKRLEMVKSKVFQSLSPREYIMDYSITSTFEEEGQKKSAITTYLMPRSVIEDSKDCIIEMGKKPIDFQVYQNSIFKFANYFIKKQSFIILNITDQNVIAHLINLPNAIITRTVDIKPKAAVVPEPAIASEPANSQFDVLAGILGNTNQDNTATESAPEDTSNQVPEEIAENITEEAIGIDEVLDVASKLIQYQTIKYAGTPVECIYIIGESAAIDHIQALENNTEVNSCFMSDYDLPIRYNDSYDGNINSFIYTLGAAIPNNELNFFKVLALDNKPRMSTGKKKLVIFFSLLIGIEVLLIASLFGGKYLMQSTKTNLEDFLASDEVAQVLVEDEQIKIHTIKTERALLQFNYLNNLVKSSRGFRGEIYNTASSVKPSNVRFVSVAYADGQFTINCTTGTGNPPADFAKALEGTGLFTSITYKGFQEKDTNAVIFSVICALKEEVMTEYQTIEQDQTGNTGTTEGTANPDTANQGTTTDKGAEQ